MTCHEMEARIPEYLAGETGRAERAAVEQHLMDCAACREQFNLAKAGWEAAARWPDAAPPEALVQRTRLSVRLGGVPTPFQRRVLGFLRAGTLAAAVLLVVLALGSLGQSPAPRDARTARRAPAPRAASSDRLLASVPPSVGQLFVKDENGKPAGELEIQRIEARVEIADGVARTEVEEIFLNKSDRRLEGTFFFPLPPDASIARLAMEINGKLEEGTVEERQKARQVYEGIVRRMQDPALLEWQPGGVFKCRVFPIEPRSDKRIVLTYEQALPLFDGRARYVYPLAGETAREKGIGVFDLQVLVRDAGRVVKAASPSHPAKVVRVSDREVKATFSDEAFKPEKDFVLDLELESAGEVQSAAYRPDPSAPGWFAAFVTPVADAVEAARGPRQVAFLLDASASVGTAQMDVARRLVERMSATLGAGEKFTVGYHHVEVRTMGEFVANDEAGRRAANAFLYAIKPAGACDLERGLRDFLAGLPDGTEVVYVGEGTPTLGESEPAKLVAVARAATAGRQVTIRTVAVGSTTDRALLSTLSREFNGGTHVVSPSDDVESRLAEIARTLGRPALNDVEVSFEGAVTDVVPAKPGPIHFGERLIVAGRYAGGPVKLVLSGKVHGRPVRRVFPLALPERSDEGAHAKRLWAQRALADLVEQGDAAMDKAVAISKEYKVLCKWTSLLVLESEEAYKQHGVSRSKTDADLAKSKKSEQLKDKGGLEEGKKLEEKSGRGGASGGRPAPGAVPPPGRQADPQGPAAPRDRGLRSVESDGRSEEPAFEEGGESREDARRLGAERPAPRPMSPAPENAPREIERLRRNLDEVTRDVEEMDHNETAGEEDFARGYTGGLEEQNFALRRRELGDVPAKSGAYDFGGGRWSAEQAGKPASAQSLPATKFKELSEKRQDATAQRLSTLKNLLKASDAKGDAEADKRKSPDPVAKRGADVPALLAGLPRVQEQLAAAVTALKQRPRPATPGEAALDFEGQVHYAAQVLTARIRNLAAEAARRRDSLRGLYGDAEAERAYQATMKLLEDAVLRAESYAAVQAKVVESYNPSAAEAALRELSVAWDAASVALVEASFDRVGRASAAADRASEIRIAVRPDALVVPGDVFVLDRGGAFVAAVRVDRLEGSVAVARVYADLWVRAVAAEDRATRVHTDSDLWGRLPDELRQDILSKGQLDRIRSTMRALREMKATNPQ